MTDPSFDDRRRSFGTVASDYDRFRPGYPVAAIAWALGSEPRRVLDLAAGTGHLTRSLLAVGHDVVAVEPDEQMLAVLRAHLDVPTHLGSAEDIPLPEASVEAVVVGQAFHWFDRAHALSEMARVLMAGGSLGLLWNVLDDRISWVRALTDVTGGEARWSLLQDEPDPDLSPYFTHVESEEFPHLQTMDLRQLLGLVGSWSHVYLSERRDEILADAELAVRRHIPTDQLAHFELPYVTSVVRAGRG